MTTALLTVDNIEETKIRKEFNSFTDITYQIGAYYAAGLVNELVANIKIIGQIDHITKFSGGTYENVGVFLRDLTLCESLRTSNNISAVITSETVGESHRVLNVHVMITKL